MKSHTKVFSKYRSEKRIYSVGSLCIKMGKIIDTIKKVPTQTYQASKSIIIKMICYGVVYTKLKPKIYNIFGPKLS